MFDRIAHRYDLSNRLLSFSLDASWRKKVSTYLPLDANLHVLDLATGTGDLAISLLKNRTNIVTVKGVDISSKMIAKGKEKIAAAGLANCVDFEIGDATNLRFADNSFDVVTIAFGIRNVLDINAALHEMRRVLKPSGQLIVLEFSLPSNYLIRSIYLFYFRYLLPFFGGLLSGDKAAYHYLNQSVEKFPHGVEFLNLLERAKWCFANQVKLTFGVASIYTAYKED